MFEQFIVSFWWFFKCVLCLKFLFEYIFQMHFMFEKNNIFIFKCVFDLKTHDTTILYNIISSDFFIWNIFIQNLYSNAIPFDSNKIVHWIKNYWFKHEYCLIYFLTNILFEIFNKYFERKYRLTTDNTISNQYLY